MTNIFKLRKSRLIAIWYIGIFLFGILVLFGSAMFSNKIPYRYAYVAGAIILLVADIAFLFYFLSMRLVITDTAIIKSTVFKTKKIDAVDIKGVISLGGTMHFLVLENMQIPVSNSYEKWHVISSLITEKFKDISQEFATAESDDLLNNPYLGVDKIEREYNLKRLSSFANYINIIAIITSIWFLIFPAPYSPLFLILVSLPLVCTWVMYKYSGVFDIEGSIIKNAPHLSWALMLPAIALAYRAFYDWALVNIILLVLPLILFALIYFFLFLSTKPRFSKPVLGYLGVIGITLLYGYGIAIIGNSMLDKSEPIALSGTVLGKIEHYGMFGTCTFEIQTSFNKNKVRVSRDVYDRKNINDVVSIYLYHGQFNIPWYKVW